MNTDKYITELFIKAGWHEGRKFNVETLSSGSISAAYGNAVSVLREYGGLNVGEVGTGREMSASDIAFRSGVLDFGREFHNYWGDQKLSLFAFASAHHDHMLLMVDANNEFYVFTDPDEQLYKIGSFDETVKRVLLGISYGVALEKNA